MKQERQSQQKTQPDLTSNVSVPIPMQIGPYKIESQLSKGGMSILYIGTKAEINAPIVIKVLSPRYVKNHEIADRFLKEAQIISMADHPNIIKLYGQGSWEKGLYIAMEFIQGISLRQFILQKSLSQKRALEILLQVAYALCHLHTHGVIHRDLKPENILITESGQIKVIDFGIAQLHADIKGEKEQNRIIGTPIYMSPEQKENPLNVSYTTDIYSLGIIAYELILGRLSHGVIHLSLLPKSLRKIIEKALQVAVVERYSDIVDMITDISEYLKSLGDEKTEKIESASDELLEQLYRSQKQLIFKPLPNWPQIELGLARVESLCLTGLYYDFFELPGGCFATILLETEKASISSFLLTFTLRGMIRSILNQKAENQFHPIGFIQKLKQLLLSDHISEAFFLSLLVLDPEKDQLLFISCSHSDLIHTSDTDQNLRFLKTPNAALGSDVSATVLETADNWVAGDVLILPSLNAQKLLNDSGKAEKIISDNIFLPPQKQAEKILEQVSSNVTKRSSVIITFHRVF